MGRACSKHVCVEKRVHNFSEKPEGKNAKKCVRRWEYNIKTYLRKQVVKVWIGFI
jgi:hypothetical protein